jgi:DNA-binding transcriptional LysR family regulator
VAAFPAALATIVAEAAAAVLAQRPAIELITVQAEAEAAIQLLRTGQADVAVTTGFPAAGTKTTPPDGMQHVTVLDEPVYLIERGGPDSVPPDGWPPPRTAGSRPDSRPALTDADLAARAGQRWIAGTGSGRDLLLRLCARAGFTPAIACTTDDYAAAQALVAAGLGVTVLPGLALRALRLPAITATAVPGVRHRVTAVTHADPAGTPAARRFVRALVEAAGQRAVRQPG